jgi:hypothetical protein
MIYYRDPGSVLISFAITGTPRYGEALHGPVKLFRSPKIVADVR